MTLFVHPNFPNSYQYPFEITSPYTPAHNCIAWAYEDSSKWYWPDTGNRWYWPEEIPRKEKLSCFIALFDSICYRKCKNGDLEKGFTKIAIFVDQNGKPTHAAKQLLDGYWTSKLGDSFDVRHTILAIEGGVYGYVAVYMKRPKNIYILNLLRKIYKPFKKARIKRISCKIF